MKISLSRIIPLNTLGNIFIFSGLLFSSFLLLHFTITYLSISLILFILGLFIKNKNVFLVFRNPESTMALIQTTLNLLNLNYTHEHGMLIVDKTRTKIRVKKLGIYSIVSYSFIEKYSRKEKYIAETINKYQR